MSLFDVKKKFQTFEKGFCKNVEISNPVIISCNEIDDIDWFDVTWSFLQLHFWKRKIPLNPHVRLLVGLLNFHQKSGYNSIFSEHLLNSSYQREENFSVL